MRTLLLVPLLLSMTATSVPAQTVEDEWLHTLENLTYLFPRADFLVWLPLTDGEHRTYTPSGIEYTDLRLAQVAFGEIDGDGRQDAVVILVYATVMKEFSRVAVVADVGGEARYLAGTTLSNRNGMNVAVDSLWLESGIVYVEMTRHTEDDANCCPSLHLTNGYVLDEDQTLVELDPDPYEDRVIWHLKSLGLVSSGYEEETGSTIGFTEDWATQNYYEHESGSRFEYEPSAEISVEIDSGTEGLVIAGHHVCSVWTYQSTPGDEWPPWERVRYEGIVSEPELLECSSSDSQ